MVLTQNICLQSLKKKATAENYPKIRREVNKKNLNARKVYEYLEFIVVEEMDVSLCMEKKV